MPDAGARRTAGRHQRLPVARGEAIRLTPKAWAVLDVLVARAGQLVTKETLLADRLARHRGERGGPGGVYPRDPPGAGGHGAHAAVHRDGAPAGLSLHRPAGAAGAPAPAPAPAAPAAGAAGAPRLVGREAELRTLHGWLAQARRGTRCVGFVTGEAGIGKTTLVDVFVAQAAAAGALGLGRGQCIEHYGAGRSLSAGAGGPGAVVPGAGGGARPGGAGAAGAPVAACSSPPCSAPGAARRCSARCRVPRRSACCGSSPRLSRR